MLKAIIPVVGALAAFIGLDQVLYKGRYSDPLIGLVRDPIIGIVRNVENSLKHRF